jgi:hypothetical protein
VDVGTRCWRDVGEGVDMGHHFVTEPPFVRSRGVKVDVVQPVPHLRDGIRWNRNA